MLTRVPEEIRQAEGIKRKAIGLAGLLSQEPLKFQFYYGDENNPEIINTIYLKDSHDPLKLYLKVFNDSNEVVTFKDPKGSENPPTGSVWDETASATNCHFHLHFEKDLGLDPDEIEIEPNPDSGQWQVNYDDETNFFAVYFLHKQELSLPPHEGITICFLNLTANTRTVKTSNVALLYGGNNQVSTRRNLQNEITSRITISVINHLSKTQIPLQFRVLGSNKILNDGTTKNTLTLKVFNSPLSNNERPILSLDQSSKFIVSFEQGKHQDALVATTSQLNNVRIEERKEGWVPTHTASSTQWSFTPRHQFKQFKQWKEGQGIELSITNLVTSSASGLACIYIDYQNIGSYPDGRLVIPIEKTPLLYSEENVGIGINQPQAKLHVGGNAVISGKVGIGTTTPKIHLAIGDDDTGLKQQGDGILDIYTDNFARVRVDKNGNVGIGINPQAQLHVRGNAVIGGKVAIGTTTIHADTQLQVNGNIVLGKNENNKKFMFYTRPNENGDFLQITHDNQSGDWEWNQGIVLKRGGNVGIGTTTPAAKLHVNGGNAVISGNVGIGTTTPKIHLAIGDDNTGLKHQGDGVLAIYTNGIEQVRVNASGNVGIGTNEPQAQLHVTKRIRLDDVPVWDGPNVYDVTWGHEAKGDLYNVICREGSSERYKQNIMPLEDDFQKILTLEPKAYQMKEGHGNEDEWQFGYIAEELDQVGLKSLVVYDRSGRPDGIQYKKMCIYLNEVLKNQQNYLERLENKVNELNQKLTAGQ